MRHELKYECSSIELEQIKQLLNKMMISDPHQGSNGYNIRSIYYDTYDDRYLFETTSGVNNRNKYRLRVYNHEFEYMHLEKKSSINNMKSKIDNLISIDDYKSLLYEMNICSIADEMYIINKTEKLQPKVIVEYDRYALIDETGNVRITFDKNIRCSSQIDRFFEEDLLEIPILPNDKHILEIKYDNILPSYISSIINVFNLERISFSKYALCRNVIINNGRMEETYEY